MFTYQTENKTRVNFFIIENEIYISYSRSQWIVVGRKFVLVFRKVLPYFVNNRMCVKIDFNLD
jgi:hypothetical protein